MHVTTRHPTFLRWFFTCVITKALRLACGVLCLVFGLGEDPTENAHFCAEAAQDGPAEAGGRADFAEGDTEAPGFGEDAVAGHG